MAIEKIYDHEAKECGLEAEVLSQKIDANKVVLLQETAKADQMQAEAYQSKVNALVVAKENGLLDALKQQHTANPDQIRMQHELDKSNVKAFWLYPILMVGCYLTTMVMLLIRDKEDSVFTNCVYVFAGASVITMIGFMSRDQIKAIVGVFKRG